MIAYSLQLFRSFVSQRSLKLISKNFTLKATDLRQSSQINTINYPAENRLLSLEKQCTEQETSLQAVNELIKKYPSPESINWKDVKAKLMELKIRNHRTVILQTCLRLGDTKTGLSFYNYLIKNGLKLTAIELVFFIKLLDKSGHEFSEYESLIKSAYEDLKEYMKNSKLIQSYIMTQMVEIPSVFNNLAKDLKENLLSNSNVLIKKAFELKNAPLAYEILNKSSDLNEVFEDYINYLCKMVVEGKFTPDMINNFVEICENNYHIIQNSNFISLIQTLLHTLNDFDKNYVWTYKESKINKSVCSHCRVKLVDKCISENDFNLLKESFLPIAGLTEKNVFLSSSQKEIQRFSEFLKSAKPYDIVLDGMNLIFLKKFNKLDYLKYLINMGPSVLVISRSHSKLQFINKYTFKERMKRDKVQFFFTENWSDDDVFLIQAALHGGLGTYIFSNDFLNKYGSRLTGRLKLIYFKWKLYHHIIPSKDFYWPPLPHLNLSQLTTNENGQKLTWHLSYFTNELGEAYLYPKLQCNWICLQATKRSSS